MEKFPSQQLSHVSCHWILSEANGFLTWEGGLNWVFPYRGFSMKTAGPVTTSSYLSVDHEKDFRGVPNVPFWLNGNC